MTPRNQGSFELLNYHTAVPLAAPVLRVAGRRLGYRYLPAEAAHILGGDNRVEPLARYSKLVRYFSDDGVTFFGAYGPKVVDQLGYVVETLARDPTSRQAVLTIWREKPPVTRDVPCTLALQFLVRGARLHVLATMRSSDLWLGWPYDVHTFATIGLYVLQRLREGGALVNGANRAMAVNEEPKSVEGQAFRYPTLEPGTLYLTVGSQHLYDRHREAAETARTDLTPRFDYVPLTPTNRHRLPRAADLVDHLWALARRDPRGVRGDWLTELLGLR